MGINLYSLENDCVGVHQAWLTEVANWRRADRDENSRGAWRASGRTWFAARLLGLAGWLDPSIRVAMGATLRPSEDGGR